MARHQARVALQRIAVADEGDADPISGRMQEAGRDDRPPEGITRIIVAKNRSGPIGDVDLVFLPASTKFYELNEHAEE